MLPGICRRSFILFSSKKMVPPPGTTTTTTNPQAPPPPPPSGPAAASSRRCSSSSSSSSMCTTLWRPVPILVLSGVLRVLMLLYGLHQDATSLVKYTDIDYLVFTDAARYTASLGEERGSGEGRWRWGGDPYERETYRYTPLLAWLLVPTTWGGVAWFSFGKVLFAAGDQLLKGAAWNAVQIAEELAKLAVAAA